MAKMTREEMELRYELFDRYALKDQRWYYEDVVTRNRNALRSVNFVRASLALLTGVASALAALLAQSLFVGDGACTGTGTVGVPCGWYELAILVCIILSVALPAASSFFNSLMDLYQWDRLVQVYQSATENINVADALSPDQEQPGEDYARSYYDYVDGTLQVMADETAQWGQSIRTPRSTERFLEEARKRAAELDGDADMLRDAANKPPDSSVDTG